MSENENVVPVAGGTQRATGAPTNRGVIGRLARNPLAVASVIVFAAVVVVSVAAPLIAPYGPNEVIAGLARKAPGPGHPFGGDGAGRDVLSRLVFAGRLTLTGAAVTVVVAMLVGIPSGLVAGYHGKWFDGVTSWFANIIIAIPGMVLLLAFIAAVGPQTIPVMAVFGVLLSPGFFRLVRTAVQSVRNELYVDAARIAGLSDARIITRHVLSVVRGPIVIQAAISAGAAVLIQTGLQFLGLGEQGTPSWGQMLSDAFTNIYSAPYLVFSPGLTIAVTVAALALFGNALRDALQDRPVRRRRRRPGQAVSSVTATASARADRSAERRQPIGDEAPLLSVRGLTIAYPAADGERAVVSDVDLAIDRGQVLGVVGESGSGKTQTAFAVLGLLPGEAHVAAGSIRFDDTELGTLDRRARAALRGRRIAYVPQEPMSNLDPSFTIGHQLVEPMRAALGISRPAAKERALELLATVGIVDPARTFRAYPHQVSGGMAQRVLIAGAISCDPELLIADEPTTALDVTVQAEILDLLRRLQRDRGMALLLVTHDFGVVADICDRVVVMQNGRVVEENDVATVFSAPHHEYTRMLLGSMLDDAVPRPPLASTTAGRHA
ncbi:dipeptide/oligopeptide/nickel ABC transporter permease/ATP-binding protein [Curtobacterium sp. MCBA15_001]|uniref:dipeptide/oligopeptide/nickel ABC transporter permease/ATP-binding protein n=1 Tax=Curtobacterium sp. MCBA15_001 TaxID=1898731 RepID=UPI0008DE9D59|nr:dipeptide/oligopeptide/nickel ABC transporter permease/ATP-binding protein [Curtobacterium sp. MCBA15_001]OIH94298.1 ABC transporter [Curtobacterium sp. MCBA15_001]